VVGPVSDIHQPNLQDGLRNTELRDIDVGTKRPNVAQYFRPMGFAVANYLCGKERKSWHQRRGGKVGYRWSVNRGWTTCGIHSGFDGAGFVVEKAKKCRTREEEGRMLRISLVRLVCWQDPIAKHESKGFAATT